MSAVTKVIFAVLAALSAARAEAGFEPELKEFLASPAILAIQGYQRWISAAKGSSCPMTPSDSSYALQAIRRHGIFEGGLLTADRLHRCGHDLRFYPIIRTQAGLRFFDPVPDRTAP